MKLLHIDSSISGEASTTRQISAAIVGALKQQIPGLRVVSRDLDRDPIPHLDSKTLASVRPTSDAVGADDGHENAAILQEFLDADIVVIGAPMYNFNVSSQLKAWLDRVLVTGKTFRYTQEGPVGLAGGKKVIIASSRGGLYAPGQPQEANDFQETYLRAVFAFIGINDVEIIRAEGVAYGPEYHDAALGAALESAASIVARLALAEAA